MAIPTLPTVNPYRIIFCILLLAWTLSDILKELDTGAVIATVLQQLNFPIWLLASTIFIISVYVQSIDHLPTLLPKESSEEFAGALLPHLLQLGSEAVCSDVWQKWLIFLIVLNVIINL